MTEQYRVFKIDNKYGVSDDIANYTLAWDTSKTIMDGLCNLLNNLNDKNESLQKKHRQLQMDYNELAGINTDYRELTYDLTDLIEDLGSEEMRRQMKQILNNSHISEFKCWAVKGE